MLQIIANAALVATMLDTDGDGRSRLENAQCSYRLLSRPGPIQQMASKKGQHPKGLL